MPATRAYVLSLYRAILREARQMPTDNRRQFVQKKARLAFRESKQQRNPEELQFLIQLAEVQLENVTRQRQLLNQLKQQGNLKS